MCIICSQDQDVPKEVSAEAVELYSKGLKREFYTHRIFARWCAEVSRGL